ncbi:MAG: hypothetical protein RLZZ28_772, partial [Bacteroidota bacterium]
SVLPGAPSAVSFTNPANPSTTVNGLSAGTYFFVWTISNNVCADSRDTVQVIVYPPAKGGLLRADEFVCVISNSGNITLSGFTGTIDHWEISVDSGSTWTTVLSTKNVYPYANLNTTTLFRVLVSSGSCNSVYSNTVKINVNTATVAGKLSTPSVKVCATYNNGDLLLSGYSGTILQWEYSADDGKNWDSVKLSTGIYSYQNLVNHSMFRVLVQNGVCPALYSDTVRIDIDAATIAGTLTGAATICNGNNSGRMQLTGNTGKVLHWESSTDNGISWNLIATTAYFYDYTNLNTTTLFRVLVQNGVCGMVYSNMVLITAIQPVSVANAGPNQVLCHSDFSTILEGNTPVSGTGKWTMLKGPAAVSFSDPTSARTVVNGLIAGRYLFAWTISNGICPSSESTVTVDVDNIRSNFRIAAIYDCGKTTFRFLDSSRAVFGIRERGWSVNPGDTIRDMNTVQTYLKEGKYFISLTVISNTGCASTASANFPVSVYEFPKADINAISDACKSQLLQLSPTVNSKDSILYLLWNLGNGQKTRVTDPRAQYNIEGEYTVKLVVSTINNCYDSAYKQIVIHPNPVITVSADQRVCRGDSLQLKADGAISYIWKDENNNVLCSSCASATIRPVGSASYKVIGVNAFGCTETASTNVRVIQPFKITATPLDTICMGDTKRIFVNGAQVYNWQYDPSLSSTIVPNPYVSPRVTTTYRVTGKDLYNCFADSASIKITVGNPTDISIGRDTVILTAAPIELHATASMQNIRKWQWKGNATFSCLNCSTTVAKVVMDEVLTCTATNVYGCVSVDTIQIKTFCPGAEVFIPNAFSPDGDGINDKLYVQGRGLKIIKSFRIYNRWGELVFEKINFMPGDAANGWDGKVRGKAATPDVFVYVCEAVCDRGVPALFKGNVAILK